MKITVFVVILALFLASMQAIASAPAVSRSPSGLMVEKLGRWIRSEPRLPAVTVMLGGNIKYGRFLVDRNGRTLYMFKQDALADISCYARCAADWPPLINEGALVPGFGVPGDLDVTPRSDGSHQVTYNGMPLYYYAGDTQPGQARGQGRNGEWYVVVP
jgi:predicted lipoprotein with Yx(FWY)xxD motif